MSDDSQNELYQTLLEDRRKLEYGGGIGISLNFRLYRRFLIGADLVANAVKYCETYNYKEIIFRDPNYPEPNQLMVPSKYVEENSGFSISPRLRLKLSYSFGKR